MKLLILALMVLGGTIALPIPEEFQGNTQASVLWVDPLDIPKLCGQAAPGFTRLACAKGHTIIMPNPCLYPEAKNVDSYAHLECHEKAHVLGWVHE